MIKDVHEGEAKWGRQTGFRKQQEIWIPGLGGFVAYIHLDKGSDMLEKEMLCGNLLYVLENF